MARVRLDYEALGQVAVNTASADTLASLLGLSTDDECLKIGVIVQADTANSDDIFLGGVDGAGAADAATSKSIKLAPGAGFVFEADENTGDEDQQYYDLRRISVRAGVGGQLLNISSTKTYKVEYTR